MTETILERRRVVRIPDAGDVQTETEVPPRGVTDLAGLTSWHADVLGSRHPALPIPPAIPSPVGPPGSLLRYARIDGRDADGEHLIALYAVVHGAPQASTARAPRSVSVEALSGCLLNWVVADSGVIVDTDEFRTIEALLGAPAPAVYVPEGSAASVRQAILAGLAGRGIVESSGPSIVTPGYAPLFASLVHAEHLAWITWNSPELGAGWAVIGRRDGHSSMLRPIAPDLFRVDPLYDIDIADFVASLLLVPQAASAPAAAARGDDILNSRDVALGAPDTAALFTIRLVRASVGEGMDAADVSWIQEPDGSLRLLTLADPARADDLRASSIDAAGLRERLHDVFDHEGAPR